LTTEHYCGKCAKCLGTSRPDDTYCPMHDEFGHAEDSPYCIQLDDGLLAQAMAEDDGTRHSLRDIKNEIGGCMDLVVEPELGTLP